MALAAREQDIDTPIVSVSFYANPTLIMLILLNNHEY